MDGIFANPARDREAATRYAGSNVIVIKEIDDVESRELLKLNLQDKRPVEDEGGTAKLLIPVLRDRVETGAIGARGMGVSSQITSDTIRSRGRADGSQSACCLTDGS